MKKFLFVFISLLSISAFAQKATIIGTVLDKDMNNEPMAFADVTIQGTTIGSSTDIDGHYTLQVDPGTYTVVFSFMGYETIKESVSISAGETKRIDKTMASSEGITLTEIEIQGTRKKETEQALLNAQKESVTIVQAIGSQELSRKAVSDASGAVAKVTGISKQEGSGNIFVRGLGDRYNVTTLNGLPLPSNNPSRKNIDLNLFSTDVIQYIGISKIFNPKNYGDFGGADINIQSKIHSGKPSFEVGITSRANSNALSQDNFYLQDGPNYSGFYTNDYPSDPLNGYNFDTKLNRVSKGFPVGFGLALNGGRSFEVGEDGKLNLFATGSFDNGFKYREGVTRGAVTKQSVAKRDLTNESYKYTTNATLMANLEYRINNQNNIAFNTLYINSTEQKLDEYEGVINIYDNAPKGGGYISRESFERTQIFVNQLLGEHKLTDRLTVNWGGGFNNVNNTLPDRRQNMLVPIRNNDLTKLTFSDISPSDNNRFYQTLKEDEFAANISADYKFGKGEGEDEDTYRFKFSAGYSGRFKKVNFEVTQFNFKINEYLEVDKHNLDAYFTQENFDKGYFDIKTFRGGATNANALKPQTYDGDQIINAGFASLEAKLTSKLTAMVGARFEQVTQEINWNTQIQPAGGNSKFDKTEILPSLSAKYAISEKQNLKFGASKTYTLPQFKERAPFLFEEIGQSSIGNPYLYPSSNYNVDLKWEFFPASSEVLAVTAFGKLIQDPINQVTVASATNDLSYFNTGDEANVYGIELEFRKKLFKSSEDAEFNSDLTFGLNVSYLNSNQEFDKEKIQEENNNKSVNFTNNDGQLTGASDLLGNVDLSYFKEFSENKNIQLTVVGAYFSDRVYAIGTNGVGNAVDKSFVTLDFVAKSKLSEKLSIGLSVKNILNPTIERVQETQNVVLQSYKKGVNSSISLKYQF
ncbi:TonB-dependent receptor [Aureivirga sp. CE67]|uniref:TonB-dependent receptor n=1 Tax=Aureivirga sp. CE67 TaxID=1788983 RepID=UPI0018CBB983|nr:TonB-dependent receptor [Aureivirga sp. CE67]